MTARVSMMVRPTSRRTATQHGLIASLAVHAALLLALPLMMRHVPPSTLPDALSEITVLPPRQPKAKPKPPPAPPGPAAAPKASPAPAPAPAAAKPTRSAPAPPQVAPTPPKNTGTVGRERARKEVAQQVAAVTGSVNQVLADLSTSLASTDKASATPASSAGGRRRTIRTGRSEGQIGATSGGMATASVDAGSGGIGAALIAIESVTQVGGTGVGGSGTGGTGSGGAGGGGGSPGGEVGGTGSGPGVAGRSNASLLAVVRRYAPGIQFCYDNELKRNPSLRGKIVLGLVVAASGEVTDVQIVEDTLGASTMRECVLAQVRAWRFPPVAEGSVGFRTPFVFTPPR